MTNIRKPEPDGPVKSRLNILIKTVLDESSFDPTIKRIVSKMIINFLKNASETDIKEKVENLRDEIIPFILYGKSGDNVQSQDTHTD